MIFFEYLPAFYLRHLLGGPLHVLMSYTDHSNRP